MGGLSRRGARGCGKGLKIDIFALMTHTGTNELNLGKASFGFDTFGDLQLSSEHVDC